ncbi:MAG: ferrochelatase [Candidatus Omnitrophica bacterium]|nr:ferrochelatase [Candidatus Omnitrophota bacterium]
MAYQSRPVSAQGAWLSPEIDEEVKSLAVKGEKRVLVVPLGFICDHAEILYDLDHAARGVIEKAGMEYLRAKTVLHHPKITTLFRKLIER